MSLLCPPQMPLPRLQCLQSVKRRLLQLEQELELSDILLFRRLALADVDHRASTTPPASAALQAASAAKDESPAWRTPMK